MKKLLLILGLLVMYGSIAAADGDKDKMKSSIPETRQWQRLESPAGFYSVQFPRAWHSSIQDNIANIMPEDESGAVTISAFHGNPPVDKFPSMIRNVLKDETPTSDATPLSRNGWHGITQTFKNTKDNRQWIAIVAYKTKVFVLITANEDSNQMPSRRATYERILETLELYDK